MKPLDITPPQLAAFLGGRVEGDFAGPLAALSSLADAAAAELTFASTAKHAKALAKTSASAAIVPETFAHSAAELGLTLIRVPDMDLAIAALLDSLCDEEDCPERGIHETAVVAPSAIIGADVAIGAGVHVGADVIIGDRTVLFPGVKLGRGVRVGADCALCENVVVRYGCELQEGVRIGPSSVIGYDGFGYFYRDGEHHKVPHAGNVVIESGVEIGACSCVDRAKFGSTRVGKGTKIDNFVQVAHNVQVGPACLLVAQVGIAGSTQLGTGVVLGGHVGIRDNIKLASGVQVTAYSAVSHDIEAGVYAGSPAKDAREKFKEYAALGKLPDALKRIRILEKQLQTLQERLEEQ